MSTPIQQFFKEHGIINTNKFNLTFSSGKTKIDILSNFEDITISIFSFV